MFVGGGGGGGGVTVGSGVDVSVGGSEVGVSVGGGVGVSVGSSGIGVSAGSDVGVAAGTRVCSTASTRLGVLVGVGVTWLKADGPQARIGAMKMARAPGRRTRNCFI